MAQQPEKVFADGLISKRNQNAPDFVIINQSYKVDEFIAFLNGPYSKRIRSQLEM